MSTMRYIGGPRADTQSEPRDDWPAPDGCAYPDDADPGLLHWYYRLETLEEGVHVYDYAGTKPREEPHDEHD